MDAYLQDISMLEARQWGHEVADQGDSRHTWDYEDLFMRTL